MISYILLRLCFIVFLLSGLNLIIIPHCLFSHLSYEFNVSILKNKSKKTTETFSNYTFRNNITKAVNRQKTKTTTSYNLKHHSVQTLSLLYGLLAMLQGQTPERQSIATCMFHTCHACKHTHHSTYTCMCVCMCPSR